MEGDGRAGPPAAALRAARGHFRAAALFSGLVNILCLAPSLFMLQVYGRVVPTRGGATLMLLIVALGVSATLDLIRMRLLPRASMRPAILRRVLGAHRVTALHHFDTVRGTLTGPAIVAPFDALWAPINILACFLLHVWIGAPASSIGRATLPPRPADSPR